MSQPESKSNKPSKMKKLLNGGNSADDAGESPLAKLQRSVGSGNVAKKAEGHQSLKLQNLLLRLSSPNPSPSQKSKPKLIWENTNSCRHFGQLPASCHLQ